MSLQGAPLSPNRWQDRAPIKGMLLAGHETSRGVRDDVSIKLVLGAALMQPPSTPTEPKERRPVALNLELAEVSEVDRFVRMCLVPTRSAGN